MKQEILNLIQEFFQEHYSYDDKIFYKILLKTSISEKKEIIEYCEQQIKKIHVHYSLKIIFIIFTLFLGSILWEILGIKMPYIFNTLLTILVLVFMFKLTNYYSNITRITTDFLFGGKYNTYDKLLQLREILSKDNYYHPLDCFDCINFHGKSYQGQRLVCGIHPYGLKDCPDFKSKYQANPQKSPKIILGRF